MGHDVDGHKSIVSYRIVCMLFMTCSSYIYMHLPSVAHRRLVFESGVANNDFVKCHKIMLCLKTMEHTCVQGGCAMNNADEQC